MVECSAGSAPTGTGESFPGGGAEASDRAVLTSRRAAPSTSKGITSNRGFAEGARPAPVSGSRPSLKPVEVGPSTEDGRKRVPVRV